MDGITVDDNPNWLLLITSYFIVCTSFIQIYGIAKDRLTRISYSAFFSLLLIEIYNGISPYPITWYITIWPIAIGICWGGFIVLGWLTEGVALAATCLVILVVLAAAQTQAIQWIVDTIHINYNTSVFVYIFFVITLTLLYAFVMSMIDESDEVALVMNIVYMTIILTLAHGVLIREEFGALYDKTIQVFDFTYIDYILFFMIFIFYALFSIRYYYHNEKERQEKQFRRLQIQKLEALKSKEEMIIKAKQAETLLKREIIKERYNNNHSSPSPPPSVPRPPPSYPVTINEQITPPYT